MYKYLDFKDASCRDCYKCLRECPVKAISIVDHQARIIESRCILCGRCTKICPQNAKAVHSETDNFFALLKSGKKVVVSLAPSFASAFYPYNFAAISNGLSKLGVEYSEETAVGAKVVSDAYIEILEKGKFKNFITSACPGVNRMIQLYYPEALKYLAPVDTPMQAHAKMLKKMFPDCAVVFIGPCIAKKREAQESKTADVVLTFEELKDIFALKNIELTNNFDKKEEYINRARYYPISRGIIKSFPYYPANYEYVAVDGVERCNEVLKNIENLSGMFLELNCCEYACVNGPCTIRQKGESVKANEDVRNYALKSGEGGSEITANADGINLRHNYDRLMPKAYEPTEREIREILSKTSKFSIEDELNCGACGYDTCREKAWAVANGYADIDMCMPYMRARAESMSYEIIQNTPNGIVLLKSDFTISEVNAKAKELLGIPNSVTTGEDSSRYFNTTEFIIAQTNRQNLYGKQIFIEKTGRYAELNVVLLEKHNVILGVLKDVTEQTQSVKELNAIKLKTLETTDEVVKKQMRVAQEIASLLGETTAETKVAILKLKKTLTDNDGEAKA